MFNFFRSNDSSVARAQFQIVATSILSAVGNSCDM